MHEEGLDRLLADRAVLIERSETMELLRECVIRGCFGQVYFPSSNYPCSGNFVGVDDQRVRLALDPDTQAASLSMFGLCSLYFLLEGRAYLGLSRLVGASRIGQGAYTAEIETPSHLSCAEPRSSARLAVPDGCDFTLQVYFDGRPFKARPINVSLGGMLLDFGLHAPAFGQGAVVQVQGTWAGIVLNVPALVRWVDGNSCGIFFSTAAQRTHPPASPELLAIVEKLLELNSTVRAA